MFAIQLFLVSAVVALNIYQWNPDNWTITSNSVPIPHFHQQRMSLSNGYLGISVAGIGPFSDWDQNSTFRDESNGWKHWIDDTGGWPLENHRQTCATIAGFYGFEHPAGNNFGWLEQYGNDFFLSGVPHWAGLLVKSNGFVLNASVYLTTSIEDFSSTLGIISGHLSWSYKWRPGGKHDSVPIQVDYTMFVHKLLVNVAVVQMKLTATHDVNVSVFDVLEGNSTERTEPTGKGFVDSHPQIWSAVSPRWVANVTAYIYSPLKGGPGVNMTTRWPVSHEEGVQMGVHGDNESSIAQAINLNLQAGKTVTVEKYIGGASTDAFPNPQSVARKASYMAAQQGFDELLASHKEESSSILPKDSVDDYYLDDSATPRGEYPLLWAMQISTIATPLHILQNTVGLNAIARAGNNTRIGANSIPVCGLGSDCYGGLIFWDTDI